MTDSWAEKYRPEKFSEIQGNNKALKHIEEWAEDWTEGDKPQLLSGDPGTGKTTTAMVVSDVMGYPLQEVNTSSERKSAAIEQVAEAMRASPVASEHQVVLLDEVDSFSTQSNLSSLYEQLRNPQNPVILTANEKYEVPNPVKNASKLHSFKLSKASRKAKLKEIIKSEGLDLSDGEFARLVERPDLRTAINDLQSWSNGSGRLGWDQRSWSESEFDAVGQFLKGEKDDWRRSMGVQHSAFDDPGSALLWIDENCSQEFRGLEAGVAYDCLSRADVYLGRAQDSSDYRYWKFASALIETAIEARLSEPYDGYVNVNFPNWFRSKKKKYDRDSGEAKLYRTLKGERGYEMSGSYFEFRKRILPILKDSSVSDRRDLVLEYGLSDDAIEALGLNVEEYYDWRDIEPPEEGDGWTPESSSASEVSW